MGADEANGAQAPSPEQLQALMLQQIVAQALQLLGLIGVSVDTDYVRKLAETELANQAQLVERVLPTFSGTALTEYPRLSLQLAAVKADSVIFLPGKAATAAPPIVFPGCKRLPQGSPVHDVAGTFATLTFLFQPGLRVAAAVLGVSCSFFQHEQERTPRPRGRG